MLVDVVGTTQEIGRPLPFPEEAVPEGLITIEGVKMLDLEYPLRFNPAALNNPITHALPQVVNRTGTTPCCKARSRFPSSRRSRRLFASTGRNRIASRDTKRSDRRKVWACFR